MKLREVARLRLRNQRVAGGKCKSAEDVVGWLAAVQSQEYALARVFLDGQLVGWWRRAAHKDAFLVETKRFRPLRGAEQKALTAAVRRYADFIDRPVRAAA